MSSAHDLAEGTSRRITTKVRKATAGLSGLTRVPKADSLQQASTALSDQLARSRSLAHRGAAAGATYAAVVGVLVALWITSTYTLVEPSRASVHTVLCQNTSRTNATAHLEAASSMRLKLLAIYLAHDVDSRGAPIFNSAGEGDSAGRKLPS